MRHRVAAACLLAASIHAGAHAQELPPSALDCLIEPFVVVNLGSPAKGILAEVLVTRGDFVKKGQYIAKLESGVEEVNADLARQKAENNIEVQSNGVRLDYQRKAFKRVEELHRRAVSTVKAKDEAEEELRLAEIDLQDAKTNKTIAEIELRRAEAILEQRTIRSPIRGLVTEQALSPGEFVHEQANIITIAQIDPLRIETFVPIDHYGSITPGMQVEIRPEEPIGGRYTALVTVVDQVFDAASGTFGVRMLLPNPDQKIPAGLQCTAHFPAS